MDSFKVFPVGDGIFVRETYGRQRNPAYVLGLVAYVLLTAAAVLITVFVHPILGLGLMLALVGALVTLRGWVPPYLRGSVVSRYQFRVPHTDMPFAVYPPLQTSPGPEYPQAQDAQTPASARSPDDSISVGIVNEAPVGRGSFDDREPPSLGLIFSLMREHNSEQREERKELDTKARFNLALGTFLVVAASGLHVALAARRALPFAPTTVMHVPWLTVDGSFVADILTATVLITFLAMVACAYMAYKIRSTADVNPESLIDQYLYLPEASTKIAVVATLTELARSKHDVNAIKAIWTQRSLAILMVETLVVCVMVASQFLEY